MSIVPQASSRPALLAVSHGTSSREGDQAVAGLVSAVGRAADGSGVAVRAAFVDVQQPDVPTALGELPPGAPTVIVPLLLSAGYHVHVDLADAVVAAGEGTVLADALGPDPRLAAVLERRLVESGLRPDDVVVLCAAGSSDARAVGDCHAVSAMLSARLTARHAAAGGTDAPPAPVEPAFISAARPEIGAAVRAARAARPGRRVVVSTYLLAPGYFADLAAACGADMVAAPLLVANEPPPPELVTIVLDRYAARVTASG